MILKKNVHSKSYIEYELVDLSESVSCQLQDLHKELETIYEEIENFEIVVDMDDLSYYDRIRTTIHQIHTVQTIDGIMNLLSFYPAFRTDKMSSQVHRKLCDCWGSLMDNILDQPEDSFFYDVIEDLRILPMDSKNVN